MVIGMKKGVNDRAISHAELIKLDGTENAEMRERVKSEMVSSF